jgi:predicted acylesterase/phospholipase RssA
MIKKLIISGGSIKTISVIGCLKYLENEKLLSSIDTFIGTSAGSVLCFFLSIGYTIDEIIHFVKDHLLGSNLYSLTLDEVLDLNMLSSFGMDSGTNVAQLFEDALFLKIHKKEITFLELAKMTGKNLVVCVANITKSISEYFSVDTYPNTNVITALRMSISLPIIFTPIVYNDCYYVDGGIYESFPVSYINTFRDHLKDTLGIYTVCPIEKQRDIKSMFDYITSIFSTIVEKANLVTNQNVSDKIRIIRIEFDDMDTASFNFETLSFELDELIINEYIKIGYDTIMKYFQIQTP